MNKSKYYELDTFSFRRNISSHAHIIILHEKIVRAAFQKCSLSGIVLTTPNIPNILWKSIRPVNLKLRYSAQELWPISVLVNASSSFLNTFFLECRPCQLDSDSLKTVIDFQMGSCVCFKIHETRNRRKIHRSRGRWRLKNLMYIFCFRKIQVCNSFLFSR